MEIVGVYKAKKHIKVVDYYFIIKIDRLENIFNEGCTEQIISMMHKVYCQVRDYYAAQASLVFKVDADYYDEN
jgi:hypothetical protein